MSTLKDFACSKEGRTAFKIIMIILAVAAVIKLLTPSKLDVTINNGNDCNLTMPKNSMIS